MNSVSVNTLNVRRALGPDTLYYIENCLHIRTKEEALIPFKLNNPQRKVFKLYTSLVDSNIPIRVICLKARQMGLSTLFGGLLFSKAARHKYNESGVVAHKEDPSVTLFAMYTLFFKELPQRVRPMHKYSSRKELIFENPSRVGESLPCYNPGLRSRLAVYTAGSEDFARSKTIQNLHWSEVAFTKDAENVHGMVLSAVPKPPASSMVFYESTANGPSGLFHDLFWEAWRHQNDWTAIFLPWYDMEEYAMPVPRGFALTDDEYKLQLKYGLADEQMVWRRWILVNDFRSNESKFMQEYPACPEEAFQSSMHGVFDIAALTEMESQIREPLCSADPTEEGLLQRRDGLVKIWEWPVTGQSYLLTIDAAGGKASGDKQVAHVLRVKANALEQVAMYVDKIHPMQFGANCVRIAKTYNSAVICPERNYHGVAVIAVIEQKGYYNIFRDSDGEYGVHVGPVNKYLVVDSLAQSVWRRQVIIHDKDTLTAMKSYQERGDRFYGPEDDYVDSLRMGTYCAPTAAIHTPKKRSLRNTGWGDEWTTDDWDKFIEKSMRRR